MLRVGEACSSLGAKVSGFETRKLAAILAVDIVGFSRLTGAEEDRTLASSLALLGRRTARNDAAACQDEPIAAPFLNSQDAPRPRDRISGRYLLQTMATVNHGDAVPCILDAVVSEQQVGGDWPNLRPRRRLSSPTC